VLGDSALRTQDADIAIARIAVPQMAGAPSMTEVLWLLLRQCEQGASVAGLAIANERKAWHADDRALG
jgi:hypothetical protein